MTRARDQSMTYKKTIKTCQDNKPRKFVIPGRVECASDTPGEKSGESDLLTVRLQGKKQDNPLRCDLGFRYHPVAKNLPAKRCSSRKQLPYGVSFGERPSNQAVANYPATRAPASPHVAPSSYTSLPASVSPEIRQKGRRIASPCRVASSIWPRRPLLAPGSFPGPRGCRSFAVSQPEIVAITKAGPPSAARPLRASSGATELPDTPNQARSV